LKFPVLLFGHLFLLGKLTDSVVILLLDAINFTLDNTEFLVELLSMLLSRLLVIVGFGVLTDNHVMEGLQVLRLAVETVLQGLLLLFVLPEYLLDLPFVVLFDSVDILEML
jgi:hypothetical protein